MAFDSLSVRTS